MTSWNGYRPMQGVNVIVQGRDKPLYIKTRAKNGLIVADFVYDGKVWVTVVQGTSPPLVVIKDLGVVVAYDS